MSACDATGNVHMDPLLNVRIQQMQDALDAVARACLRVISSRDITIAELRKLSKFMFGCMNQKYELQRRVETRGPGELDKVLEFATRALELISEIDARLAAEEEQSS